MRSTAARPARDRGGSCGGSAGLRDDDLSEMAAAAAEVDRASAAEDLSAMAAANRRFHFLLIEAAQMPRLARMVRILWDATDAYRSMYYASGDHRKTVHHEHEHVLAALQDRDIERAVRVLYRTPRPRGCGGHRCSCSGEARGSSVDRGRMTTVYSTVNSRAATARRRRTANGRPRCRSLLAR